MNRKDLTVYDLIKIDDDKSNGMLGRFALAVPGDAAWSTDSDQGVRALACHFDDDDFHSGFYLTGGVDRKLRMWDMTKSERSAVISGLDVEEAQPAFVLTQPTTSLLLQSEQT